MKALQRFKTDTRNRRNRRQWTEDAMRIFLLANAIVMHDKDGFGKARLEQRQEQMLSLIDETIDRYGGDCIVAALEHKCREFGYEVK